MAGVHQQAEQSNFLAEGQIKTCKLGWRPMKEHQGGRGGYK